MGIEAAIIASTLMAGASAVDSRNQAKKAEKKAEKQARMSEADAAAAKGSEIASGRRDAEMRKKSLRAYAAGNQSLLSGSGVQSSGLMG
jgi:hypothetical protein